MAKEMKTIKITVIANNGASVSEASYDKGKGFSMTLGGEKGLRGQNNDLVELKICGEGGTVLSEYDLKGVFWDDLIGAGYLERYLDESIELEMSSLPVLWWASYKLSNEPEVSADMLLGDLSECYKLYENNYWDIWEYEFDSDKRCFVMGIEDLEGEEHLIYGAQASHIYFDSDVRMVLARDVSGEFTSISEDCAIARAIVVLDQFLDEDEKPEVIKGVKKVIDIDKVLPEIGCFDRGSVMFKQMEGEVLAKSVKSKNVSDESLGL